MVLELGHTNRSMDRIDIDPHIYMVTGFSIKTPSNSIGKGKFSSWSWISVGKKTLNIDAFTQCTLYSKWITDLNVKSKTIKLEENNVFMTLGTGKDIFRTQKVLTIKEKKN